MKESETGRLLVVRTLDAFRGLPHAQHRPGNSTDSAQDQFPGDACILFWGKDPRGIVWHFAPFPGEPSFDVVVESEHGTTSVLCGVSLFRTYLAGRRCQGGLTKRIAAVSSLPTTLRLHTAAPGQTRLRRPVWARELYSLVLEWSAVDLSGRYRPAGDHRGHRFRRVRAGSGPFRAENGGGDDPFMKHSEEDQNLVKRVRGSLDQVAVGA